MDIFNIMFPITRARKVLLLIVFVSLYILIDLSQLVNCSEVKNTNMFTVNKNYFYYDGKKFLVKGINYNPEYPGEFPWDISNLNPLPEKTKKRIQQDIKDIKSLNANTIRIWENPGVIYEYAKKEGLFIFQTIWIDGAIKDYHSPAFKLSQKKYIRFMVDRVHNVNGADYSDIIIAYPVGNELSEESIMTTDTKHPEINHYNGKYTSAPYPSTPTECFIAEMSDYLKDYEQEKYGKTHLVTYINHVVTDSILKCGFLDFLAFNGFSNSVPEFSKNPPGSKTGTDYQGWLEKLKSWHPNKPVLITEFGLSTAPDLPKCGPPNYGYGGNTEDDQADGIAQMWQDISTCRDSLAGGIVFEFNDGWWMVSADVTDKNMHDEDDGEEWFGIISIDGSSVFNHRVKKKKAFYKVREIFQKQR